MAGNLAKPRSLRLGTQRLVDECVYTLVEMWRYEDPVEMWPEAWQPRPFDRDHPVCGGILESLYVRTTKRGRATWVRVGWRCKHCGTAWMEREGAAHASRSR